MQLRMKTGVPAFYEGYSGVDSEDRLKAVIAIIVGICVVVFILALSNSDNAKKEVWLKCLESNSVKECEDADARE